MKRSTKPKAWLLSKLARKGTSASETSVAIGRRISSVREDGARVEIRAEVNRRKIRRITDMKELFQQMKDHA